MLESEIRRSVKDAAVRRFADDPETLVVDELFVDHHAARIDVAVVNGSLHGFEIKSERDTLQRLPQQAISYARVFDAVTLVVANRHVSRVEQIAPTWFGIEIPVQTAEGVALKPHRLARPNPSVDPLALAQLLWRDEALDLLDQHGAARGLRCKPRVDLWRTLAELIDVVELGQHVRACLRERSDWRVRS